MRRRPGRTHDDRDLGLGGAVDTSWVLMLVFAVGGFAGILLTALMVVAGGPSEREEPQDLTD